MRKLRLRDTKVLGPLMKIWGEENHVPIPPNWWVKVEEEGVFGQERKVKGNSSSQREAVGLEAGPWFRCL
jgi:hypothetical protein